MANTALASTNQARKKGGGARLGAVYAEKLPVLSSDDERGLEALIKGATATDAWRIAHPDTQCQPGQDEWSMAMRWRRQKNIVLYLEAATQAGINRLGDTLIDHVQRLHALASESRLSGNYGAAIQAEVAIGRAQGHYIERHELTIRRSVSFLDTINTIERLLGPDSARKAALRLGVPLGTIIDQPLTQDISVLEQAEHEPVDCLNVEHILSVDVDNCSK